MGLRSTFLLCIGLFFASFVFGQRSFNDSIALQRNQLVKGSMLTLGAFAIANIATGFPIASHVNGEAKYAWRMNGYWNFVNLGLAGMGYLNALKTSHRKYDFADNMQAQHALEKIYIFNSGLDLAYIASGLYLRERGKTAASQKSRDQLKGYGTSIIAQGGFLLLMDAVVLYCHHRNTIKMDRKLKELWHDDVR